MGPVSLGIFSLIFELNEMDREIPLLKAAHSFCKYISQRTTPLSLLAFPLTHAFIIPISTPMEKFRLIFWERCGLRRSPYQQVSSMFILISSTEHEDIEVARYKIHCHVNRDD